jgi:hypothetical protein
MNRSIVIFSLPLAWIIAAGCAATTGGDEQVGQVDESLRGGVEKVTICHVPPGNPENAHTITIGEPAVKHHLANHEGDHIGPCENEGGGGAGGCDCPDSSSSYSSSSTSGAGGDCPND